MFTIRIVRNGVRRGYECQSYVYDEASCTLALTTRGRPETVAIEPGTQAFVMNSVGETVDTFRRER